MKGMKKVLALLLCASLTAGVCGFSACGEEEGTPSDQDGTEQGSSSGSSGSSPSGGNQQGSSGNQSGGNQQGSGGSNPSGSNPSGSSQQGGSSQETEQFSPLGKSLDVSRASGVYTSEFTLEVSKKADNHTVYFTTDGTKPTVNSSRYASGIRVGKRNSSSGFPLTNGVVYDSAGYGNYNFQTGNECTVVNLLETDASGAEVARKTVVYLYRAGGTTSVTLPIVTLNLPQSNALSFYNDIAEESKERANLDYFDFVSGESFSLNTQVKLGGNWTMGFPYRTMNLNFAKDENGKKNARVTAKIFGDRAARNGGELTDFTRFRLHSGGNAQTLNWFGDAFTQRVAAEVPANDDSYLQLATTGYRPAEVYLNGEYWGLYAIREHYSDVYFAQNYGVDKDDVILIDRAHNITAGNPDCADTTVYNTQYAFELKEDDELQQGMSLATELFDFLMTADLSLPENYQRFTQMVDIDGLSDLVLVNLYAGNWDFMNNNIKMWRTANVNSSNPYADGKWRFCLHDLDFSFEMQWGDNGLTGANGYLQDNNGNYRPLYNPNLEAEYTNPVYGYRPGVNYLDFYLGNAYLQYNGVGFLRNELTCLLKAPMRNANFRENFIARAQKVKEVYNNSSVRQILQEMKTEVAGAMSRHVTRWGRAGYRYSDWEGFVTRTDTVLQERTYMRDYQNYFDGGYMYKNGDYFNRQVEAAIYRFMNP